jgi:hypothetical protein
VLPRTEKGDNAVSTATGYRLYKYNQEVKFESR